MNKKSFVIIILVIIFGVFLYVPVKEVLLRVGITSSIHGDNWKLVRKTKDPVYDKVIALETDIENRYNNYFPFYNKINSLFYSTNSKIDELYSNNIYLKDNSDNEHLFLDKENSFYYLISQYSSSELDERMNTQVDFYNDIKAFNIPHLQSASAKNILTSISWMVQNWKRQRVVYYFLSRILISQNSIVFLC